jgi:hypothetical protein
MKEAGTRRSNSSEELLRIDAHRVVSSGAVGFCITRRPKAGEVALGLSSKKLPPSHFPLPRLARQIPGD